MLPSTELSEQITKNQNNQNTPGWNKKTVYAPIYIYMESHILTHIDYCLISSFLP